MRDLSPLGMASSMTSREIEQRISGQPNSSQLRGGSVTCTVQCASRCAHTYMSENQLLDRFACSICPQQQLLSEVHHESGC